MISRIIITLQLRRYTGCQQIDVNYRRHTIKSFYYMINLLLHVSAFSRSNHQVTFTNMVRMLHG